MAARSLLRTALGTAAMVIAIVGCSASTPVATPSSAGSPAPGASAAVIWPRPADTLARTVTAGLTPDVKEHLATHVHAHLDVFVDGQPVVIPAGIGIDIDDPEVKRFDEPGGTAYGGITECADPCISPLHTHDESGILHTESPTTALNTLGQFFDQWGVALTDACIGEYCDPMPIAVYIDGEEYTGDIRAIELVDRRQIAVVIGTPPAEIPATADFSRA